MSRVCHGRDASCLSFVELRFGSCQSVPGVGWVVGGLGLLVGGGGIFVGAGMVASACVSV